MPEKTPNTVSGFNFIDRRTDKERELQKQIDELNKELRAESAKRREKELDDYRQQFNGKFVKEIQHSSANAHVVRSMIKNVKFVGLDFIECEGVAYEISDTDIYDSLEKQSLFNFRFYDGGTIRVNKTAAFITKEEFESSLTSWKDKLDEYLTKFMSNI